MMESVVEREDQESENRLSLGGKKRSSRRSSILKITKSPMKALEDIDPNLMTKNRENRESKARRSTGRRVSFARTYEVKEFCKDDELSECQGLDLTDENIGQQVEKAQFIPSEYRQPSVTIKGLESLLKGDIQNTGQLRQENLDMDLTEYYNRNIQGEPALYHSDMGEANTVNGVDALDLTCHGQGVIDQQNMKTGGSREQLQYNTIYIQTTASKYDDVDFTVCQTRKSDNEVTYPSCERTVLFSNSNNNDASVLDLTCHGRGLISNSSHGAETTPKFSASSFIQSLGQTKAKQLQGGITSGQDPRSSSSPPAKRQNTEKVDVSGFLLSLSSSKPRQHSLLSTQSQVYQQNISSKPRYENSFSISHSTLHTCQGVEEEEEDMEMTTCIDAEPSALNTEPLCALNPHTFPEAQMDMTTCVPPTTRVQEPSMVPEAQMDMTTCVPPTDRTHKLSFSQKDQINVTACELLPLPLEITKNSDDLCRDEKVVENETDPSPHELHHPELEEKDENPTLSPPIQQKDGLNNRKRSSSSTATNRIPNQDIDYAGDSGHTKQAKYDPFYSFKSQENQTQSWLNRTTPLLTSQTAKKSHFQALPSLSVYLLGGDQNKTEPQITHGPVCNVPISKFCSQSAKKRKMSPNVEQEASWNTKSVESVSDDHTYVLEKEEDQQQEPASTVSTSGTDTATLETSDHHEEEVVDPDGEISFKAELSLVNEQISSMETTTGLIDEPTLEFAADVVDGLENNNVLAHGESNGVQEEGPADTLDNNPKQSTTESKTIESNLSTICEETELEKNKTVTLQASMAERPSESVVESKKMTVAELLKRASVSFNCAIEQVSRRSTFGYIKKSEKPEDDKECMQLSMVLKPQATHYSQFCTDIKRELGELKIKMQQQEQSLNDSDTPVLFCTDEDKMSSLETQLKNLKRSVCKKYASARWIERTGIMKKSLASVLKTNHDVIATDVSAVNESLAVANDCDKIIDSVDEELGNEIQALRESLQKDHEESTNVEEVNSALREKISQLAARESELQQVEERRAGLISTKESLTAEKENLEREKMENEVLLTKATKQISREKDAEKLIEKYDLLKWCLEWELEEWDHQRAKFLFVNKTLELVITFDSDPELKSSKTVENVGLSSLLADTSSQSARFCHSLILRSLDSSSLVQMSPTSSSISKILDHVSKVVSTARSLEDELFSIFFKYLTTVEDNRVLVIFSSIETFLKFTVELSIDLMAYPDNVGIAVTQKIGKPCCQNIEDKLKAVPNGPRYITNLVNTAQQFLEKM